LYKKIKYKIPIALIIARFLIGFLIIILNCTEIKNYKIVVIVLLSTCLLTDIFDSIVARRLNVSTQETRRWGSAVNKLFFTAVIVATDIKYPEFMKHIRLKPLYW
jgi:phosphatidylglycerophosphate synthase